MQQVKRAYTTFCGVVLAFRGYSLVRVVYRNYMLPFLIVYISSKQIMITKKDFYKPEHFVYVGRSWKSLNWLELFELTMYYAPHVVHVHNHAVLFLTSKLTLLPGDIAVDLMLNNGILVPYPLEFKEALYYQTLLKQAIMLGLLFGGFGYIYTL